MDKAGRQLISRQEDVTPTVIEAMSRAPDERLREIMASLVTHLHRFIIETRPTEAEFERALDWIVGIGQSTNDHHNEVVLAADVLGASTLIDLINNDGMQGETMSALLGPFYRGESPPTAWGGTIARSPTPGPALVFEGRVVSVDGSPVAGATIDVWQASPDGLYENQDAAQADYNLRGRLTSRDDGRFLFRSVKPAGYPVPTDGPVGDLLRAQLRTPMRPAHIHFLLTAPGHKTLVTQIFADDFDALAQDVVFGAKQQIVGDFVFHDAPHAQWLEMGPQHYVCRYDFVMKPGAPSFPKPPIRGKKG